MKQAPGNRCLFLSVDFRFVGTAEDVVDTDVVKLCQAVKGFGWRYSLTVFKFGKERLLDSGLHL